MTAENYPRCLANTLVFEGGYANNPRDPGGATMRGITQATYDAYRRKKGLALKPVRGIAEEELQDIYRNNFWNLVDGDDLPKGVDQVAFDGGVNSGPSRGVKWVAQALKLSGNSSAKVTALAAQAAPDKTVVVKRACAYRLSFLRNLGTWGTFGSGWGRRVATVEAIGVKMALEAANMSKDQIDATLTAEKEKAASESSKNTTKATVSAGGSGTAATQLPHDTWLDLVLWGGLILFGALVVYYFVWWRKANKERAAAYEAVLQGLVEVPLSKLLSSDTGAPSNAS